MRPVMLDTNAYTAFKLGDAHIVNVIKHAETIGISPIVLGELISGFDSGAKSKKNRQELQAFLSSSRIRFFSLTDDTANFYSHIYCILKKKGKPIPTNDLWIAAQVLEHGCVLCTHDKHFEQVEGLLAGSTCA